MKRRQFIAGALAALAAPAALAGTGEDQDLLEWTGKLTGCLCPGCGRKLEGKLLAVDGILKAKMEMKTGKLVILTTRKIVQRDIVSVIGTMKFKLVELSKPVLKKKKKKS